MPEHDEHLGHLLWEVFTRVSALSDRAFAKSELSKPSLGLLETISDTPGIGIAEVTRRVPVTQQAVSQGITRLEAAGLVERRLLGGRSIGLFLTAAGVKARRAGSAEEVAFEHELETTLGKARYDRLRSALIDVRPAIAALQHEPKPVRKPSAARSKG